MQQLTREEVAAALERVYARAEFAERSVPAVLRWVLDTWAAVKLWIASLFGALLDLEGTRPIVFWIIVLWLTAALLAAVVHIGYTISLAFRGRSRRGAVPAEPKPSRTDDSDPSFWEARARAAAAAGQLREAALALYHAVILRLDTRGAVRFRTGKTPGDYRREARTSSELGGRFDVFLRIFHPLAFGPHDPETALWESLRAAAMELDAHA